MKSQSNNSVSKMMCIGNEMRRVASVSFVPEKLRGLNTTQMGTLLYLWDYEAEGVFQKDIEAHLRIRRSSVSSQLHNMERSGIIKRLPVPEDARLKRVLLTEKGRDLCREVEAFHREIESYMMKILTQGELDALASILGKLVDGLDESAESLSEIKKLGEQGAETVEKDS